MLKFAHLPLVALASLSLAACGATDEEDEPAEIAADNLEERGDRIEERTDEIEGEVDDMDLDQDMDDMAMNDPMMGGMGAEGVTVRLSGFEPTGTIYVALQDETVFGGNDATYGTSVEPMGSSVDAVITGITPGDYALAVFQDTNGNGMLDLGGNGVPTEPWYLSNDAGKSGAPEFDDASNEYEMGDSEDVDLGAGM